VSIIGSGLDSLSLEECVSTVIDVKVSNFEKEVLKSKVPVVIDFWAPWCGPCKAIAPAFKKLAEAYAGKVKFVKVNIDEEGTLATKFRVQAIPTLLFFAKGKRIGAVVGGRSAREIDAEIKNQFKL
jgi:thioredoxin